MFRFDRKQKHEAPAKKNLSVVSAKGLTSGQTMFLSIVIGFSLGMVGLIALALMVWLSNTVIGVDAQAKHGISMIDSSRLGGLAIVLFLVTMILIQPLGLITPFAGATFALSNPPSFVLPVVIFGALGLGDDLGIVLKPTIRLTVMSVVALSVFLVHPDLMPWRLLSSSIREIQGISQLFAIFSSLVLVGYINAGNMTDGANGLFSGICLSFFVISWALTGEPLYLYITLALVSFFTVNILTGRIILGDLGAYSLAAMSVFSAFNLFNQGLVIANLGDT